MCGRFTLRASPKEIAEAFRVLRVPDMVPRYNIAPTQQVLTVRLNAEHEREIVPLKWGLIPFWADDPKIGSRMINARADTVASKPAFRSAFKKSRCLVIADGFYEWQQNVTPKQPYFVRLKYEGLFAFAGLMEHWRRGDDVIDSCAMITTEPNSLMEQFHDRMPVILSPDDYDAWLDPDVPPQALKSLLRSYLADEMIANRVSTTVNAVRNIGPECCVTIE